MIKYLENTVQITPELMGLVYDKLSYKFSKNFVKGDNLGMFASHFITNNQPSVERRGEESFPVNHEEDRLEMVDLFHTILTQFDMKEPSWIYRLCVNANYYRDVDVEIHTDFNPNMKNCYSMITYLTHNPECPTIVWDEDGKEHRFPAAQGNSLLISNLKHSFVLPKGGIRTVFVGTFGYD